MNAHNFLNDIPGSFDDVKNMRNRLNWEEAIKDELDSHLLNKTWPVVERPKYKNIVDCKWVFTIKNDEYGNPVKYKARLVARGFTQKYLIDYEETFAPVARISSFRLILSISNQYDLKVHHMDVKTAFLNGTLKGLQHEKDKVCKLNKYIYGLKQAVGLRCFSKY